MNTYDNYYPRPLLRRDNFKILNDNWLLNNEPIEVPFPPESFASNYKGALNNLIYTNNFTGQDFLNNNYNKIYLHFGAVDQICDVYLNDHFLIHHEGGYLPFYVDIKNILTTNNTLKIICKDDLSLNYPYGKQCKKPHGMWYTPVSGIWQSVWLEGLKDKAIEDIEIQTTMNSLSLHIVSNAESFAIEFDHYKKTFTTKDIYIPIENGHLWSIEDPFLYDLTISTEDDVIHSYFALRLIECINKRIYLNKKPIFLRGLLDQGYYQNGIFLPDSPIGYEQDILNMKELGFNCLRKHIKVEPEAFYYYCDKHGMLVMQDMVNSGKYSFFIDSVLPNLRINHFPKPLVDKKRYDFFIKHSQDTIKHLKNHPSIFAYTIYNEGWGQQAADKAYEKLKPLDPQRFFDSTSGWFYETKSDFDSKHIYFRNAIIKPSNRMLLLSECGGYIRSIDKHLSDKGSKWGYGQVDNEQQLMDKFEQLCNKMLIPSIHNGLMGYIYTQVSDVEGEINGLYTYDRKICKVNKKKMKQLNDHLQEIFIECLNSNNI